MHIKYPNNCLLPPQFTLPHCRGGAGTGHVGTPAQVCPVPLRPGAPWCFQGCLWEGCACHSNTGQGAPPQPLAPGHRAPVFATPSPYGNECHPTRGQLAAAHLVWSSWPNCDLIVAGNPLKILTVKIKTNNSCTSGAYLSFLISPVSPEMLLLRCPV